MISNLNISVLEDNRTYLRVIEALLDGLSIYNYKLFEDAQDFLNVSNGNLHIAVIDHQLGDTNGLAVVQRLLRKSPDCFIIIISAEGSEQIVADYMNASCDRYIRKSDPDFPDRFRQFMKDGIERMQRFLKLKHGQD